eukprot:CAMPEP_0206428286 /NCGR_PEP_ID=MMETSP0324_2-20121206/5561_1 /ASSEMBLY_ACC=CAM_ASM_000836 /TAXON_ID=2866 /ORGANISM="Crypthecodinium cohnii, Strain Seligo" /LENGTH=426 /DNA_ID=CAMNT_0053893759 /DNA_START=145 /DNA_END=1425 /DNA_ORIENTATION=-
MPQGWDMRQVVQGSETLSDQHIFNQWDFPPLQQAREHVLDMKRRRRSRSSAEARPAGLLSEQERRRGARRSISTNPFSLKKVVCASSMRRSTGGIPDSRLSLTGGGGGGGAGVAGYRPPVAKAAASSDEDVDDDCPAWPDRGPEKPVSQAPVQASTNDQEEHGSESPLENATPPATQLLPQQRQQQQHSHEGPASSMGGSTSPSDPEDAAPGDADLESKSEDVDDDRSDGNNNTNNNGDPDVLVAASDEGKGHERHIDHNDETKDNVSSDSLEELSSKSGDIVEDGKPTPEAEAEAEAQAEAETEVKEEGQGEEDICQGPAVSPRRDVTPGPRLLGAETLFTPEQSDERRRAQRSLFAEDFLEWLEERPAMLRIGAFSGKGWDNPLSNFDKRELVILNLASENLAQRDRILELEEELRCAYASLED